MTEYVGSRNHLPKKKISTRMRVPWFKIDLYLLKPDTTYK